MAPFIAVLLPTLLISATVVSARTIPPTRQETNQHQEIAVAQFMADVNAYVEWHRVLANPLADLTHGADPEQTMRARHTHRSLIREARAFAAKPKLFTPCVSEYLRKQIRLALSGFPPEPDYWPLAAVLGTLPELPVEMNYRFDGSDLVLLDVEADLVVDVLEDALPSPSADESERDPADTCAPAAPPLLEGSPCDAHQELEMCWS